jgi:hypothetical protein
MSGARAKKATGENRGGKLVESTRLESLQVAYRHLRHGRELLETHLSKLTLAPDFLAEFLRGFRHRQTAQPQ